MTWTRTNKTLQPPRKPDRVPEGLHVFRCWWDCAEELYDRLSTEIDWARRTTRFHKPVPRDEAWFHKDGLAYTYTGRTYEALPWPPSLVAVIAELEYEGFLTNSCLANRYQDGRDNVGWHRDDEPGVGPTVCTLSLGAPRKFQVRDDDGVIWQNVLRSGDLLVMPALLEHRVPRDLRVVGENETRISLTFRWTEDA